MTGAKNKHISILSAQCVVHQRITGERWLRRVNTINVSQFRMRNFCILICRSMETRLNRLWTSCSFSALRLRGGRHLSECAAALCVGERRAAAWWHCVKRAEGDQVTFWTRTTLMPRKPSAHLCMSVQFLLVFNFKMYCMCCVWCKINKKLGSYLSEKSFYFLGF